MQVRDKEGFRNNPSLPILSASFQLLNNTSTHNTEITMKDSNWILISVITVGILGIYTHRNSDFLLLSISILVSAYYIVRQLEKAGPKT